MKVFTGAITGSRTGGAAGRSAFITWMTGRAVAGGIFGVLVTAAVKVLYSSAVMVRKKSCFFWGSPLRGAVCDTEGGVEG